MEQAAPSALLSPSPKTIFLLSPHQNYISAKPFFTRQITRSPCSRSYCYDPEEEGRATDRLLYAEVPCAC
ncbi:hypothetical protein Pfo_004853 [Paulownia fortunei]|nr:hypothetical protein Pfo_004853 [Paulownia fortunei]